MSSYFSGKRVLVTGGANGLGRGIVKKLHDSGALVFTVDRDEAALETLKTEFTNLTAAVVDLTDWEATRKVIESFGPMDHLVNNAGVVVRQTFMEITKDSIEKQMNVNYVAMINVTQVVAKGMIDSKTGGSIVNVSSCADRVINPGISAYSCSKAAATVLTKSMALELAPHNIRVNSVNPGLINTDMIKVPLDYHGPSTTDEFVAKALIKRPAEPSEIADLILFLLSSQSAMMTGSSVLIDGGMTLST